jgi:hypothetical protein
MTVSFNVSLVTVPAGTPPRNGLAGAVAGVGDVVGVEIRNGSGRGVAPAVGVCAVAGRAAVAANATVISTRAAGLTKIPFRPPVRLDGKGAAVGAGQVESRQNATTERGQLLEYYGACTRQTGARDSRVCRSIGILADGREACTRHPARQCCACISSFDTFLYIMYKLVYDDR